MPPGYIVDRDAASPTFERYTVYEPHAAVVRQVFRAVADTGTPTRAARWLRDHGIIFPAFPPELAGEERRSSLTRNARPLRVPGGFGISPSLVRSIATNPAYQGWWLVEGRVISTNNHLTIVDAATFLLAQERMEQSGRGPRRQPGRASADPRMLSGLLFCTRHDVPTAVAGSRAAGGRYLCVADYDNGRSDHACTTVEAELVDEPVADVVLNRCSFPQYADAVVAKL